MAKNVKSTVKLNMPMVRKLTVAAATSLEMTAEAIHTDVVQSQVIPRDTGKLQGESTHISAGKSETATYENGQTVTNSISKAVNGKVIISTSAPQARRLYYHPEYNFHQTPWTDESGKKHEGNANARFCTGCKWKYSECIKCNIRYGRQGKESPRTIKGNII